MKIRPNIAVDWSFQTYLIFVFVLICYSDGDIELMIHRRLLVDDHWGVAEPLNETAFGEGLVARGKHYLLFDENDEEANRRQKLLANELYAQPLVTFSLPGDNNSTNHHSKKLGTQTQKFNNRSLDLPPNLNMLSLKHLTHKDTHNRRVFLIRLEHLFDIEEHSIYSKPAELDLKYFVRNLLGMEVEVIEEMSLGGNEWGDVCSRQRSRLEFKTDRKPVMESCPHTTYIKEYEEIVLLPMQIRTFQLTMKYPQY